MPGRFLTETHRKRLSQLQAEIPQAELIKFFTLSAADLDEIRKRTGDHNRLGYAMLLCSLRYLGFVPDNLTDASGFVVNHVARQLEVPPESLSLYGSRSKTRTENTRAVQCYLGFHKATDENLRTLEEWLLRRALEHNRPTLLLKLACEKLYQQRIVRPTIVSLERMIVVVRGKAQQETFRRLEPILTGERKAQLDQVLVPDKDLRRTPLAWLRQEATTNSANAILDALKKLSWMREWGVDVWSPPDLNPNRMKFLSRLGRRASNQALQRTPEQRRYPILVAFLRQSFIDITDEAIDMVDRCLAGAYTRAGRDLEEFRRSVARATNEKLMLFREIGAVVLDPQVSDKELRAVIYRCVGQDRLQAAVAQCDEIIRPQDDSYFDFLKTRYSYIRRFAPAFLEAFHFQSNAGDDSLIEALDLIRELNRTHRRKVPEDAPVGFIPPKWRPYVTDGEGRIDRQYYELCTLWKMRDALRSGDLWLKLSRRYASPESYLIPQDRWPELRAEVCQQIQAPEDAQGRLGERQTELEELLDRVDQVLQDRDAKIRMDDGGLVVSPLEGEERPQSAVELEQLIDRRLPYVELTDLLIEVDAWTQFSRHFTHAGGSEPRSKNLQRNLYAAILAQGCNIGPARMAQIADVPYDQLAWTTNWYIREETLKAAYSAIVDYHHRLPLTQAWGDGAFSSSDGQRFVVTGKVRKAAALPRYFGYGRGVTFYSWSSDQFSQYGSKVIPTTVRDATYVLDGILDNETELHIKEHTTDTAGYTELIFALFDLLGLQFSPRIRDIGNQRLYRIEGTKSYCKLEPQLKGRINRELIEQHWDDLLRVAGSLKQGWVPASLLVGKLQSYPRQNRLLRALQEYGRLAKTIFILRYLEDEEYRRRINAQLNKGEALHALRRFLYFANTGKVRRKRETDLVNQESCLTLLTDAVVTWNTVYMGAAIEELRSEGHLVDDEDLIHLSPSRYEHINPYGKYRFDVEGGLGRTRLRPLRRSD